jgi:hypothetical protein
MKKVMLEQTVKPKIILSLIAGFAFTALTQALGSSVTIPVNATNIQTMPFLVRVEDRDGSKQFSIIADPKAAGEGMYMGEGSLAIYDGTNAVSSCSVAGHIVPSNMQGVKAPLMERGVLFEFSVATNYLASSQFCVAYYVNGHPAVNFYTFNLKDFVDAK